MNAKKYILLAGSVCCCLMLAGCLSDAPRENPLDAKSDDYESTSVVEGRVTNRLGEGVAGARVSLQVKGFEAFSGAGGRFVFSGVPAGTLHVEARKDGFAPGRDSVRIRPDGQGRVLLPLNALPIFDSVSVHSVHTRRFFPEPTNVFELTVEAQVRDPDDLPGLDTVRVRFAGEAVQMKQAETGRYVRSFSESEVPVDKLQALQGRSFYLEVIDKEGNRVRSEPHYLARVIEPSPVADTVRVQPDSLHFRWQPSASETAPYPFPHTYHVTLYRQETNFNNVLLTRYTDLAPERTFLSVPAPDRPGSYYWIVAAVDAFGNRSRSRPYGFRISKGTGQ